MKIKGILACLLMFSLLLGLVGCGGGSVDPIDSDSEESTTETTTEAPPPALELIRNGKTDFVIVYPENAGEKTISAAIALKDAIKRFTGATIRYKDDYIGHSSVDQEAVYEILLGNTNRKESQEAMKRVRADEYLIEAVGTKLVIGGTTELANHNAVSRFVNEWMVDSETLFAGCTDGSLSFGEDDAYLYTKKYTISSMTVNGTPIAQCSFVIPDDWAAEKGVAKLLRRHIRIYTGYQLPVVTESEYEGTCGILIGRSKHTTLTAPDGEYLCKVTERGVEVVSDTQFGYAEAYFKLLSTLFAPRSEEIALKTGDHCGGSDAAPTDLEKKGDVRVMYHNIWGTLNDLERSYLGDRNGFAKAVYTEYKPDVICMQEAWDAYIYADRMLFPWLRQEYKEVLVRGAKNRMYYNDAVLELVEFGYKKINSSDSGSAWAVFRHRATGELFGVINVHFPSNFGLENDPVAANARRVKDAETSVVAKNEILQKYPDIPIIHGGDYNSKAGSQPFRVLNDAGLTNARLQTDDRTEWGTCFKGPTYLDEDDTFEFRTKITATVEGAIDHISLGGKAVKVERYHVLGDLLAMAASDHLAHFVDFSFIK